MLLLLLQPLPNGLGKLLSAHSLATTATCAQKASKTMKKPVDPQSSPLQYQSEGDLRASGLEASPWL